MTDAARQVVRWVCSFVAVLVLTAGGALSQTGGGSGGGSSGGDNWLIGPATLEFMLRKVQPRIEASQAERDRHKKDLAKRSGRGLFEKEIQRKARGGDPLEQELNPQRAAQEIIDRLPNDDDRWEYFHGAELSDMVVNIIHDVQTIVSRLLSCMKFRVLGVCLEWRGINPIPDITLLIQYSFPTVKIETVDQPYKSGYFPRLVNDSVIIPLNENAPFGSLYELAPMLTQFGLMRSKIATQTLGGIYGHTTTEDPNPSQDGGNAMASGLSVLRQAYDENARWTNGTTPGSGFRHAEYHVMPEFFNLTVGQVGIFCHHILQPWWFSDWPYMILPARFGAMSLIFWPGAMAPMTLIPHVCTFKNMRSGKTPKDMLYPLAFPLPDDLWGAEGCQGVNAGPWLPVTTTVQSPYQSDAARVATWRGIKVARKLMPGNMYTWEGDDKIQWTRNDRMPKGCGGIPKWKLDEHKLANSKRGADSWHVAITWTRFKCCMGWRGETPDIHFPPGDLRFR